MQLQQIESGLKQTGSFVNMIQSVDERNQQVASMMDRINQLQNTARQIDVLLTKKLVALTVEQFETLVSQPDLCADSVQPTGKTPTKGRTY
ncbi:hypothetical protein QY895_10925 [Latilactobacillus sakei]